MSSIAKKLAERRLQTRASLLPPGEDSMDAYMSGNVQMRGPIEQNLVPLDEGQFAFAEQQDFLAPDITVAPGQYGRPLAGGTTTALNPNYIVGLEDIDPVVTPEGLDYGATGAFDPGTAVEEDLFDNYLDRALNVIDTIPLADETGALDPLVAETHMFAPELDSYQVDKSDFRAARANRMRIEEQVEQMLQERQQAGNQRLREAGLFE